VVQVKVETKKTTESILTMQRNLFIFVSVLFFLTTLASTGIAMRNKTLTFFKEPSLEIDLTAAKTHGEYLAHLILNRSLLSMEQQNHTLKPWVAPAYAFTLQEHLQRQQEEMQHDGTDFEWALEDSTVEQLDRETVRAYLKGRLAAYLPLQDGKKQLVQEEATTFVLDLKKSNGKLLLNNFTKDLEKQ
jgi:hypothetical protein